MAAGKKVIVRQTRSQIGREQGTDRALRALGLGRIGNERAHTLNPALEGMIRRVRHLVEVRSV